MAGTDSTQPAETAVGGGPAIVLVEPQLGENIGMVARAMLNCGLTDMRLVRPRDGWPNPRAVAASSGALEVLDKARLFETTAEAVADLRRLYATTARERHMIKEVATPRQAAVDMRALAQAEARAGVLFGKEAFGLSNDDIALADTILAVPLNPAFSSLNLAQAVLLVGYEWYQLGSDAPALALTVPKKTRPATKDELFGLFDHLEGELDDCGFFHVEDKRRVMVRNIRNMLERADLTEQEIRTLRGMIVCLTGRRYQRRKAEKAGGMQSA
ncbi:MAG: RNA methyltransferase [Magnetospirillum sp. WYHS-4]